MTTHRQTWGIALKRGGTYWLNGTKRCLVLDATDVTARVRLLDTGEERTVDRDRLWVTQGPPTVAREIMEPAVDAEPEREASPVAFAPPTPPEDTPKFVCPECGQSDFWRPQALGLHRYRHHGVPGANRRHTIKARESSEPTPPPAPSGEDTEVLACLHSTLARKRAERDGLDQLIEALEVVIKIYQRSVEE